MKPKYDVARYREDARPSGTSRVMHGQPTVYESGEGWWWNYMDQFGNLLGTDSFTGAMFNGLGLADGEKIVRITIEVLEN